MDFSSTNVNFLSHLFLAWVSQKLEAVMNKEKEMAELKLVFLISITHVIFAEIEIWQSCSDV